MNTYKEVRAYLTERAWNRDAIAALVSAQIFPDSSPEKAGDPHVVVREIDDESFEHLGGGSGLGQVRVEFACKSDNSTTAATLREHIRLAFQGYRGLLGERFANGCVISGNTGDDDRPIDASDQYRYIRTIDVQICYTEPVHTF